jgi:hypothetical protein
MNKQYRIKLCCLSACLAILLSLAAGCKAAEVTVPVTVISTVTKMVTVKANSTPTAAPKLYSASFNLVVTDPNDYNAYLLPLFLTDDQILHMTWKVEGGFFRMTLTTPGGAVIPITSDGVKTSGSAEKLDYSGGITFCISDDVYSGYDWGGMGYFIFTPHLLAGDPSVKVALNYYFETKIEEETETPATATP